MKRLFVMLVVLAGSTLAKAENAYIEFSGLMRGSYAGTAEMWRWMIMDNFAWEWFEDCCFTGTVSNVAFMQGKDHTKLVLKAGMDGLDTPQLSWFRKTGLTSDHRLYAAGKFEIAFDAQKIVEGGCDVEVDVDYLSSTTVGGINGRISALHAGAEVSGADFAAVFNNEHNNNLWRATIVSFSPTIDNDLFAATIRLESQPVVRHVQAAIPLVLAPVDLATVQVGFLFDRITDGGGGYVCAVRKAGSPLGSLPAYVVPQSVTQFWTLGSTMVDFSTRLSFTYDTMAVPSPARLRIFRRADASAAWEPVSVASVSAGVATVTNVTQFSEWIVALDVNEPASLPADLPGSVSASDRAMYLDWIAANQASWGQADFSEMPSADFLAAWLAGIKPVTGAAASTELKIVSFDPSAALGTTSNTPPLAWLVDPASRPSVAKVTAQLQSGASPVSGTLNGNLSISSAQTLDGLWTTDVGQTDGDLRLVMDANGRAELAFSPPSGRRFFRAALTREGRVEGTGRLSVWNQKLTNMWVTCTVDSVKTNGLHCSLAFSRSGLLGIAYYDQTEKDLKYATYNGHTLSVERVDTTGNVGQYCSLAFGADGKPAISYFDESTVSLKFAAFNGTQWDIETVDASGLFDGLYTSLAFGTNNLPSISYQSYSEAYTVLLRYAAKTAGGWNISTVEPLAYDLVDTSLAFAPNGNPSITYFDDNNNRIRYARWNGAAWITESTDAPYAKSVSLAFTPAGKPAMAYFNWMNDQLIYATRPSSYWTEQTVEPISQAFNCYPSLAFAPDGYPAIGYHDDKNGNLKYAKYTGTQWKTTAIDTAGVVGAYSSLVFSPDGRPFICYYDATHGTLKLAEWVEGICLP
jgi:hypothetical protein